MPAKAIRAPNHAIFALGMLPRASLKRSSTSGEGAGAVLRALGRGDRGSTIARDRAACLGEPDRVASPAIVDVGAGGSTSAMSLGISKTEVSGGVQKRSNPVGSDVGSDFLGAGSPAIAKLDPSGSISSIMHSLGRMRRRFLPGIGRSSYAEPRRQRQRREIPFTRTLRSPSGRHLRAR